MFNSDDPMYFFKGQVMKELSKRLTKNVSIKIYYKEEGDFVGIILSAADNPSADSIRMYRIDDPYEIIKLGESPAALCEKFTQDYKNFLIGRYFKKEKRHENYSYI